MGCGGGGVAALGGGGGPASGGGGGASSGGGGNPGGDPGRTRQEVVEAIKEGFGVLKAGKSNRSRLRPTRSEGATFDEFYQLWVRPVENGKDFFEDEACTLPAGSDRYARVYADNGSDFEASGEFSITNGPRAGAAGSSSVSNTPGPVRSILTRKVLASMQSPVDRFAIWKR